MKSWRVPIGTRRKIRAKHLGGDKVRLVPGRIIHDDAVDQERRITLVLSTRHWRTCAAKPANPRGISIRERQIRRAAQLRAPCRQIRWIWWFPSFIRLARRKRSRSLRRDAPRTARRAYWTSFAGLSQVYHLLHHVDTERKKVKWGEKRIVESLLQLTATGCQVRIISSVQRKRWKHLLFFVNYLSCNFLPNILR